MNVKMIWSTDSTEYGALYFADFAILVPELCWKSLWSGFLSLLSAEVLLFKLYAPLTFVQDDSVENVSSGNLLNKKRL